MEAKSSFLHVFEKLESFVGKLPGSLQKPILQEVTPLKDLFLRQRAPRIVVAGDSAAGSAGLFNAIFTAPVAPFAQGGAGAETVPPSAGWKEFSHADRGVLRLLDTRVPAGETATSDTIQAALTTEPPDLFLFLTDFSASPDVSARLAGDLDHLESLLDLNTKVHQTHPCVLGLGVNSSEQELPLAEMEAARARLQVAMASRPTVAQHMAPALDVATFMRFRLDGTFDADSDRRYHVNELVHVLVAELPNEARLEMARLSGAKEAQAKIAQTLVKSMAAISAALGAQPIPLADLPFLLTFQLAMVAGIIYISGRDLSFKLATQFLGTMGVNVGMGLILREGTRAAIRAAAKLLLPGVGNAISGFVAASGTYAIGRAATAYYIEGVSVADARKLFQRSQRPGGGAFRLLDRRKELKKPGRKVKLSDIRTTLSELEITPSKTLGQNFLHDQNLARWIVAQLDSSSGEQLLEIGPGLGALTGAALESGATLTVLEKDGRLAGHLRRRFAGETRLRVEHMDALDFDVRTLWPKRPVKVFGNLPYYISTPLLFHFTPPDAPVVKAVFLLQKELAERIAAASPGTRDYGILSVIVGRRWRVELLRTLPASVFLPEPKVDSALIGLTPRGTDELPACDVPTFDLLVRTGFSQRRKQLGSLLREYLAANGGRSWPQIAGEIGVKETVRGEELGLRQWIALANAVRPVQPAAAQDSQGEIFDVVDAHDRVIGTASRGKVHAENLLHRAIHILVFNAAGELFLQKRSPWKDKHPGKWDSSAAGHLDSGESYETAARRELSEELGLPVAVAGDLPLELAGQLDACAETGWEFICLFQVRHDGPFRWPAEEIEWGGFFPVAVVEEWIAAHPEDFAPGFLKCWAVCSSARKTA